MIEVQDRTIARPDQTSDGRPCWVAEAPDLPGCVAYGRNEDEAKQNLAAARRVYLKHVAVGSAGHIADPAVDQLQTRVEWSFA